MTTDNLTAAGVLSQDGSALPNDNAGLVNALRPAAEPDPKVWSRHWRRQLWRIKDLPLVAVGGGPDRKAPANLRTGELLKDWQRTAHTHLQIEGASPRVCGAGLHTGRWGADKHSILVADIDGAAAVEHCLAHSCDPQATRTWQTHRNTDACRLKVKFRLTPEQADQLGNVKTSRLLKEAIKDEAGNVLAKAEALEIFHQPNSQVVVLGEHPTSKGFYFWPDDMGPEALAPIAPEWWALVLDVIQNDVAPPSRKATSKAPRSSAGEWGNCNPCPICGRNTSNWCSRHRSTGAINCRHGNTFSPEQSHGVLRLGDTITGTDGTVYAFCGTETQSDNWRFSKFVIDKPRERSQERQYTDAELLEGFEVVPGGFDLKAAITGMDAITAALGTGWHGKENEPAKRAALACGDISRKLQIALGDRLAFDEMNLLPALDGEPLKPSEIDLLHVRLSENGWRITQQGAIDGLMLAAQRNSFHPVRQYLQALEHNTNVVPFDLDQVAPRFFRADKPLYVAMVRAWLIGAAARAMAPGCHMDYCLTLQSDQQGIGKSTGLEALASPDWFCCSLPESDKDFKLNVHSSWIYELAELEAVTGKKESGSLKNLLTTKIDKFRTPYGKGNQSYPRQSVFCATVNQREFLRDSTGNRRFWVVPIDGTDKLDTEGLRQHRDGIWKAAVLAWRAGELPMLPEELAKESEAQNEEFNTQDPWMGMLQAWMNGDALVRWDEDRDPSLARPDQFGGFSTAEALYSAGLKRPEQISRADEMRVAPLLRKLGFVKERRRAGGGRSHSWVPSQPLAQPAQPRPNLKAGGWAGQTACSDAGSQPLAQPAQPISRKREKKIEAAEQIAPAPASATTSPFVAKKVGPVGTPSDSPAAAMDLGVPTSFFEVGQVGPEVGQVGPPLYEKGDEVELLTDGTWAPGWRIARVEDASTGALYRVESNTDYKVVPPARIRLSAAALGL